MKYLVMCEGSNEREIIRILLENNCLIFNEEDLLGLTPFHARQIKNSAIVKNELNMYSGEAHIIRIGDKQSDKLFIKLLRRKPTTFRWWVLSYYP